MDKVLTFAIIFLCLASCQVGHDAKQGSRYIGISSETFAQKQDIIQSDSLFSLPEKSVSFAYIIEENLCLVKFDSVRRNVEIEVYEKYLDSILYRYNSALDKTIMPLVTKNGDYFIIHDNTAQKTIALDMKSALHENDYHPLVQNSDFISERVILMGDRLLTLNPNSYESGSKRVTFSDRNWNSKDKKKYSYNSANVIHGELICKKDGSSIAYIPQNSNELEILDSKGRLNTTISFPHEKRQKIGSVSMRGIKMYFCFAPLVDCFSSACAGEDKMALGFIDDNENSFLSIVDWKGNLIVNCPSHGRIRSLSMSDDETTIFSWERHDGRDVLWRYNLRGNE